MTTEASRRAQAAMQRADWAGALAAFGDVLAKARRIEMASDR